MKSNTPLNQYTLGQMQNKLSRTHTHTQTVNIYHLSEKNIKNIRILIKEVGHSWLPLDSGELKILQ